MVQLSTLLSGTILALSLHGSPIPSTQEPTPADGAHNAVLIFSPKEDDNKAQRQEAMLDADMPGLSERDILVSVVTPASDPELYRKTVAPGSDFAVVLVGSDGNKKFQSDQLVKKEVLFKIVDGKPAKKRPVDQLENRVRN